MGTPAPEEPQTLAAGELVWAKTKGRHHWWPARLRDACAAGSRDAQVSCFGDNGARRATQLRRFADPGANEMARASSARGFLAAVEEAQAHAVAILHRDLACACASPPPPPAAETEGVFGVANLAPSEFLASLRDAALDVWSVGLVDRARLKSWVRAAAQGWGRAGAGHYPRRSVDKLVDKIDLDVPAGEDKDAADWVADNEDKALGRPEETPAQKKRSVTALMEELDAGEDDDDQKNETGGPGPGLSVKRERKKSKYLSPPYTNLAGVVLVDKLADVSKELLPSAAKEEKKVVLDNVGAKEVLLLVRHFGKDIFHKSRFPKAAKGLLDLLRSSAFVHGADHDSYKEHKCPAENVFAKTSAHIDGLVSDSSAAVKQGKGVLKRTRKKDQNRSCGSSIKRKKMEKNSPTATLGCGVSITPAIPIRQLRAEDIRSQVKAGGGARGMGVAVPDQKNTLVSKSPISAAMSGGVKLGDEQDQANGESVVKIPVNAADALSGQSAKNNYHEGTVEATKPETDIQVDINVQSVIVDAPVRSVQVEGTKSEMDVQVDMNVQSVILDVPVRSVQMEAMEFEPNIHVDTNEQSVVADVPVRSGSFPTHGDISQPADGNKDNASVEVRTVQESYASLEAMVPEMLKKVEEVNSGTNVIATSHAITVVGQKGEQPNQKKTADEATATHFPGKATNGIFPDPANSAHKKKKKKTAQYFGNPAEILLKFENGVVLPSKEELLSEFRKFGFLIESETDILKDTRSARVVFGKSVQAEAAYNKQEILGQFGPPFATLQSLNYLPPVKLSIPLLSPASKPPLADIRKNLENMISSLTAHSPLKKANSSAGPNLLGEMQGLLSKVDKMLAGSSGSTSTPP